MNKVMILTEASENDAFFKEWIKNNISSFNIFKKKNKMFRAIRRIWIKAGFPFQCLWYGKWKNCVKEYDLIIVHISSLNLDLCHYLNHLNPDAKIIAWYWNSVVNSTLPCKIKGNCQLWSFDPQNCRDYEMRFNHQYYFKSFVIKKQDVDYDVYFCGSDSGRGKKITEIYNELKKLGFKSFFQVVYPQYDKVPKEIISERVSYDQIRKNIASSNAILELVRNGQSGATLRVMEAVFFQKKLITNNPYVKNEEFYDEDRIFIIGERDIKELRDFLNKPFVPYENELLDKYDVGSWIKNFKEGS